jgi:conjugal transfer mating pair stabilization protein TraG
MQFSNFMSSLSQGGFLSPAAIHSAYKELSLQVGVGSHIMASLPVLMSMIFALGEAAGMASVAAEVTPKGTETGKAEAPSVVDSSPLMRTKSQDTLQQFEGGAYAIQAAGSRDAASSSNSFKALSRGASQTVSDTDSREKRESEERSSVHRVADALAHRDYQSLGLNYSQGEALRKELSNNLRETGQDSAQVSTSSDRSNTRSATLGATLGATSSAGASTGGGGGSLGAGLNAGMNAGGSSGASDREGLAQTLNRASDLNLAKAVSKTLSGDTAKQVMDSIGGERSKALSNERSFADSYVESTTHRGAHTSAVGQALQETDGFVAANQSIRSGELVQHSQSNAEFRQFQRMEGNRLEGASGAKKHMALAEQDMSSRSTEEIGGDERAHAAVVRHMAATSMARDASLPETARYEALKYLVGESNAMMHGGFEAPKEGAFDSKAKPIAAPKNATGVSPALLRATATKATEGNDSLEDPHQRVDSKAKVALDSLHGVSSAAADQQLHGLKVPDGARTSDAVDAGLSKATKDGLVDGDAAKSDFSRAWSGFVHGNTAGAAARVDSAKGASNDTPN